MIYSYCPNCDCKVYWGGPHTCDPTEKIKAQILTVNNEIYTLEHKRQLLWQQLEEATPKRKDFRDYINERS